MRCEFCYQYSAHNLKQWTHKPNASTIKWKRCHFAFLDRNSFGLVSFSFFNRSHSLHTSRIDAVLKRGKKYISKWYRCCALLSFSLLFVWLFLWTFFFFFVQRMFNVHMAILKGWMEDICYANASTQTSTSSSLAFSLTCNELNFVPSCTQNREKVMKSDEKSITKFHSTAQIHFVNYWTFFWMWNSQRIVDSFIATNSILVGEKNFYGVIGFSIAHHDTIDKR